VVIQVGELTDEGTFADAGTTDNCHTHVEGSYISPGSRHQTAAGAVEQVLLDDRGGLFAFVHQRDFVRRAEVQLGPLDIVFVFVNDLEVPVALGFAARERDLDFFAIRQNVLPMILAHSSSLVGDR
jgi:hypothetical protein